MFDGTAASVANLGNSSYGSGDDPVIEENIMKTWIAVNGLDVVRLRKWVESAGSDCTLHANVHVAEDPRDTQVVELSGRAQEQDLRASPPGNARTAKEGEIGEFAHCKKYLEHLNSTWYFA
ncbi:hypothetical protein ON010_g3075 [Phytophthora cinnamomi]|nr:hypothetical protein ON010_g3075 [Phytophthora cinnamomi]